MKTFYFVPSGAVEEGRAEIYNNSCSFQPNWLGTGSSYVFQNSFSTFLRELKCMKISVLKQPDVFVKEEIDDPKETGSSSWGRKMVLQRAHVFLIALTSLLPRLAYLC
jgi:hypothetical protein